MPAHTLVDRRTWLFFVLTLTACGPTAAARAQEPPSTKSAAGAAAADAADAVDTLSALRLSAAFRQAAERAMPAVVAITAVSEPTVVRRRGGRFPFFFDIPEGARVIPQRGQGSGFIFDERGYILTNRHVVEDADELQVTLPDGRQYTATVVGTDPSTDVAVIKIEPRDGEDLPTAVLGSSDRARVGDWVLALGNPLDLQFTVTAGIISAKGRSLGILRDDVDTALEAFIQTDAAINPGNSGGPLVDLSGRVVGINTAIKSRTGFYAGYGFAIPITIASRVAEDLIKYGAVHRPRLGVQVSPVNEADAEVYGLDKIAGAEVVNVQPGTPAAEAGLQLGDVIVELDGEPIADATELTMRLARRQPGDRVDLGLIRNGDRRTVTVELGQFETPQAPERERRKRPVVAELLGFHVVPLTEERAAEMDLEQTDGVVVDDVDPFGPAAAAGIRPGVTILKMNGKEVDSVRDVERIARDLEPGDIVSLVVQHPAIGRTIINYRTAR
ncbi:MAG TPA: Do family serine endopeptidase [Longimicrobiales bacterium]